MFKPALTPNSAACFSSLANPCGIISVTEFQSLTTKPSNCNCFLRISVSNFLSPEAGIPFVSLKEVITVWLPASKADLNGGK